MTWLDDPRPDAEVLRAFAASHGIDDPRRHRAFLSDTLNTPPGTVAKWLDGSRSPPAMTRIALDLIDRLEIAEQRVQSLAGLVSAT